MTERRVLVEDTSGKLVDGGECRPLVVNTDVVKGKGTDETQNVNLRESVLKRLPDSVEVTRRAISTRTKDLVTHTILLPLSSWITGCRMRRLSSSYRGDT